MKLARTDLGRTSSSPLQSSNEGLQEISFQRVLLIFKSNLLFTVSINSDIRSE